mgnify:CR=1 FL=1
MLRQRDVLLRGDQPRTCGEYVVMREADLEDVGSAPHMRGIRSGSGSGSDGGGSAPHMRGIPAGGKRPEWSGRISPAHAGNTASAYPESRSSADQPRTCGEYRGGRKPQLPPGGSAPHMRGIQIPHRIERITRRISPAHAGNTAAHGGTSRSRRDQPRTCGEYPTQSVGLQPARGSAPHMRGIPYVSVSASYARGISPAHAGNTLAPSRWWEGARDQPRTCGEYLGVRWPPTRTGGSAPHMRGILGPDQ